MTILNHLSVLGVTSVLVLAGCSLNLPIATKDVDRELTGKFDGKWVLETKSIVGNCSYNYKRAYLNVKNGLGKVHNGKGYVSKTGDFRIEDDIFYNSDWGLRVYGGNLVNAKGRMIIDFKSLNATDCSIGFSIKKIE